MNIFHAIVLGSLQGLTEFLPISSSGHLILLPSLLGWEVQSLAFDVWLHLGTAAALIVFFWQDILKIIGDKKYLTLIGVGTIPAVTVGLLLNGFIETSLRYAGYVALFLLIGSLIMLAAEKTYKKIWHEERITQPNTLSINKGIMIGIFQSMALFSGISRSGATISGGMLFGLTRESAARFSFILSIPIVIMAGVLEMIDPAQAMNIDLAMIAGFLSSFTVGILAIKYLLQYLKNNNLYIFIYYRLALILLIITTLL